MVSDLLMTFDLIKMLQQKQAASHLTLNLLNWLRGRKALTGQLRQEIIPFLWLLDLGQKSATALCVFPHFPPILSVENEASLAVPLNITLKTLDCPLVAVCSTKLQLATCANHIHGHVSGFVGGSSLLSGISAVGLKLFLLLVALGDQLPKQTAPSVINTSDGIRGVADLAPRV